MVTSQQLGYFHVYGRERCTTTRWLHDGMCCVVFQGTVVTLDPLSWLSVVAYVARGTRLENKNCTMRHQSRPLAGLCACSCLGVVSVMPTLCAQWTIARAMALDLDLRCGEGRTFKAKVFAAQCSPLRTKVGARYINIQNMFSKHVASYGTDDPCCCRGSSH